MSLPMDIRRIHEITKNQLLLLLILSRSISTLFATCVRESLPLLVTFFFFKKKTPPPLSL